jgi:hypothetical protein
MAVNKHFKIHILYTYTVDKDAVCRQFCLTCAMKVSHLKDETPDRTMWTARFGIDFGPVMRQTAK